MTDTIEIAGREWPVRFTMGALSRFEKRTKVNAFALSDPSKLSSDAAAFLVFCGIAAGCKAEGVEFDGWHAHHDLETLPQVDALSDKSVIEERLANREYWTANALPDPE